MSTVVADMSVSLDGFVADPAGGVDRVFAWYGKPQPVTQPVEPIPGDYRVFYTGVRDALLGKANPPVRAIDAWRTARVLEWALESSKAQRDVECDWSTEPS